MSHTTHDLRSRLVSLAAIAAAGTLLWISQPARPAAAAALPRPATDMPMTAGPLQTAVLAGGCFWGVQGVFEHVRGVRQVVAGYAGGDASTATYDSVSEGDTGHAESVRISFDPAQVSFGQLLQIAFSVAHDPTQLNRQGPDTGTQYRSAVFYTNDDQQRVASAYITQLNGAHAFPSKIVTEVTRLNRFFPAERYHQDYLKLHPDQPYIAFNDLPKIRDLKRTFPDYYLETPVSFDSR
jgi:peptide-methionine (S)-S-oxide reductase